MLNNSTGLSDLPFTPLGTPEPFLFPFAIQLLNPETNSAVVLNTNSYFTASDGSSQYQVASVDTLDSQVDFNFPTPPEPDEGEPTPLPVPVQNVTWTNGQEIVFTSGLGNQFTSLVNGKSYYAIVDPSTPGVIRLADSLLQSEVANPAVQSAIPQLQTVELQPAIAGTENNFLDQAMTSILVEQADHSYHLENDASGGTFQLTLDGPEGTVTTESLAYNITAEDLEDALNSLDGILATVNSSGDQAWEIAILFRFEIGNVELDSDLVFSHDPRLADGSAVVYLGIDEKPIGNLTPGETYFVYQTQNTYFNADFPQYMLNLRATADMTAPLVVFDLEQSMTDTAGLSYPVASTDLLGSQLAVPLPAEVSIDAGNSASTSEVGTGSASFFTLADAGNFTLIVTSGDGTVQTTNTLNVPTDASTIEQHLNSLPGVNVTVTGEGTLLSPWTVVGLVDQTLGDDSSQLTNDGFASRILFTDVGQNVQQVWTETPSAGNDVTLTFTVEGQAPSAVSFSSISTAGEVAAEIQSIPNLRATVTGAGTASDPWQITSWYQSIQTGDELQFHDRWNAYNLGMLHGSS